VVRDDHILVAKNVRALERALRMFLDTTAQQAFAAEISKHVLELLALGKYHLEFAKLTNATHWRQQISRAYYGSYNCSRAIRLHYDGSYSIEVTDHDKISRLPPGFPNGAKYETELKVFRSERNTADYDHRAQVSDLIKPPTEWLNLADDFVRDSVAYLRSRGEPV
jgi:hypothetical protein